MTKPLLLFFFSCLFIGSFGTQSLASSYNNSSYFGFNLLSEAGRNLHDGVGVSGLMEEARNGELFEKYTPERTALALYNAWREVEGYEKARIIAYLEVKRAAPLYDFITNRRDQSLMQTIDHQYDRILKEAINDIDQGRGTNGLTGYRQLNDLGLKALLQVLKEMKVNEHPNYDATSEKLPTAGEFLGERWREGIALFVEQLKLDYDIQDE